MSIWVTSDNHFFHKNIIKHENRPYNNVFEMNEDMIKRWNSKVKKGDTVIILGDFILCYNKDLALNLIDRLNGKKQLVCGNHDEIPKELEEKFEWIKYYHELKYKENTFIMFHYPIKNWNKKHYGSIHLYGHVHSKDNDLYEPNERAYNVGVDVNDFYPVLLEDIIKIYSNKKIN